jgi:hypothetical protein
MATEIPTPAKKVARDEPQREAQVLADAASRIMREDVFVRSMANLRAHYMEQLAGADPGNTQLLMQLQATIRAVDGLGTELVKFSHGAARPPMKVL